MKTKGRSKEARKLTIEKAAHPPNATIRYAVELKKPILIYENEAMTFSCIRLVTSTDGDL